MSPISPDMAMGGSVTEEHAISWSQYLDLYYSQFRTLYNIISNAPRPITNPTNPPAETPVDGFVGTIQPSSTAKTTKP